MHQGYNFLFQLTIASPNNLTPNHKSMLSLSRLRNDRCVKFFVFRMLTAASCWPFYY